MRFGWRKGGGRFHYSGRKRYVYPEIIESDQRLDLLWPHKFYLYDAPLPLIKPRRLGETEPINKREDEMGTFIQNRQHFIPVPGDQDVSAQELVVLEDGTELLRQEVTFNPDTGEEPSAETLPTFWSEVGKTVTLELTYKAADGRVSYPFEKSFVQEDPWPEPEPAPPEPEPVPPEPAPLPELPVPTDLGITEPLNKVVSDARPVERRRRRR
jgi:hypothetical protein